MMNDVIKFEGFELLIDNNGDQMWTEKMLQDFYEAKRTTVRDNLKTVIEDKLGRLTEIRQSGTDCKQYKTKVYNNDAMLALGMRLRSKRAIRYQQWLIRLAKNEIFKLKDQYNKAKLSSDIAWRMLDKEDIKDLYN